MPPYLTEVTNNSEADNIADVWRLERSYGVIWLYYRKLQGWGYVIVFNDDNEIPLTDWGFISVGDAFQYTVEWEGRNRMRLEIKEGGE